MRNFLIIALIGISAFSGCSVNKESDDLAKAQKCLDDVDQSAPESASECLQYVEKYDSQQANILKCSILMTSGGFIESKIVAAVQALEDDSTFTNKEAVYMSALALDRPTVASGYDKAVAGNVFCQATGVSGHKYLGDLIVMGTSINKMVADLGGGAGIDITNPGATETAINNLLATCNADTTDANASCNQTLATLGTAVVGIADSYCATAAEDDEICTQVDEAVAGAGGVPANVGEALLCYLQDRTFNIATGECN